MHDTATIKYFGNTSAVDKITLKDQTVFTDSKYVIDVLKGLIRHDRTVLLTYFQQDDHKPTRKMWLRRINRLAIYGILHKDLIPFLWPGGVVTDPSKQFWEWACSQEEGELWSSDVASSEEDYERAITLLEGCDILHRISEDEFIVPALLAETQKNRLDARAFSPSEGSVIETFCFAHVPPGFFERLLIKCRKSYSHMDFTVDSAALYHRGLKAQLFLFPALVEFKKKEWDKFQVSDLSSDSYIKASNRYFRPAARSIVVLKCLTSTFVQMNVIKANMDDLFSFFSGMQKLDQEVLGTQKTHDAGQRGLEPIQVQLIESVPALQLSLQLCKENYSEEDKMQVRACIVNAISKVFTPEISPNEIIITGEEIIRKSFKKSLVLQMSEAQYKIQTEKLNAHHMFAESLNELLKRAPLKWEEVGSEKPATGTEIKNNLLAAALQKKVEKRVEFKKEEWEEFQVADLHNDSYIKAGDRYFKPDVQFYNVEIDEIDTLSAGIEVHITVKADSFPEADRDSELQEAAKALAALSPDQTDKLKSVLEAKSIAGAELAPASVTTTLFEENHTLFIRVDTLQKPPELQALFQPLSEALLGLFGWEDSGLKWEKTGSEKPSTGTEINNALLAAALKQRAALKERKAKFKQEEWESFQVDSRLFSDSYIKAGDCYFKPAGRFTFENSLEQLSYTKYSDLIKRSIHECEKGLKPGLQVLIGLDLGLMWKEAGFKKPSTGTEIMNELLAAALQKNVELKKVKFNIEEWDKFQVADLPSDSYIKAGDHYFKPVVVEELQEKMELNRKKCKIIRLALGLKWKETGSEKPATGTEIKSKLLAAALQEKVEFKIEEWDKFQVTDPSSDSYIKAGNRYFKPAGLAERWIVEVSGMEEVSLPAANLFVDEPTKQDQCLTVETGGDWNLDTSRLRVVLVCMDKYISRSEKTALKQFRDAVAARRVIIPIICPGYEIKSYDSWWLNAVSPNEGSTPNMTEMENYGLFVDMTKMKEDPDELRHKVLNELLPQIYKFLEEWRGEAPDPSAFAAAYDRIPCMKCHDDAVADVHIFSRKECEAKLHAARRAQQSVAMARQAQASDKIDDPVLLETCRHKHTSKVADILSSNVIYSAVPCPCCVQHGQIPPFCFDREECLLYFSEEDDKHVGSKTCPFCKKANRQSNHRILDIIAPEVFLSYNWGNEDPVTKEYSTQKIVKRMRPHIEQDAGVVCWFDVGGGMGAGQNPRKEMEEGIRKCTVVVIFISDAYCKSGNCIREFLHATQHSKYLIIVLVPGEGSKGKGWTGPGPEDKVNRIRIFHTLTSPSTHTHTHTHTNKHTHTQTNTRTDTHTHR